MEVPPEMTVQFAVLASGSRGNCTLIQGGGAGLLIDVGLGPKVLKERLESVGSSWSRIAVAVLTHTHGDHIDTATFAELARRGVTLHCHEGHRAALAEDAGFLQLEESGLTRCYGDHPFLTSIGLRLEPIELRHDAGPTFGFRIEASAARRARPVKIGYVADTGSWSSAMAESLTDVDVLGVEFNHDVAMQKSSRRPEHLIARNLSDDGHLSNLQGAGLLEAVLARSGKRSPRHVVLLHLSEQCNRPELAVQAAQNALRAAGRRADIHAARQCPAFPNLWVTPNRKPAREPGAARPARPARASSETISSGTSHGEIGLLGLGSEHD
jgi:phosphoribosyl 1,2-cyclic phosphodiesterase